MFYNDRHAYMPDHRGIRPAWKLRQAAPVSITCKTGPADYKKHFLDSSDNVTYVVEQMEPARVGVYHYRVIFAAIDHPNDFEASLDEVQP